MVQERGGSVCMYGTGVKGALAWLGVVGALHFLPAVKHFAPLYAGRDACAMYCAWREGA